MVIRSYRRVFSLDRRIYAFGDWQLPLPNGIPLRGLWYFCGALLLSLLVSHFPLFGGAFGLLPWPVRYLIVPIWLAAAGMTFDPDGRRADLFVLTWLSFMGRRVRTRAHRPSMDWGGKLKVRWDASGTELHRAHVKGPAVLIFDVPVETMDRYDGWRAEGGKGEPQVVPVRADQTLRIRP